jgi:hypothetical protein
VNLFRRWLWPRSSRREALSLYRLGIARADKDDPTGAMKAYSSAIELPNVPEDIRAMALYNRALLFAAVEKPEKALADLNTVMKMPTAPHDVKQAARRRLERLQHRQDAETRSGRHGSH